MMHKWLLVMVFVTCLVSALRADRAPIIIDGRYDDWEGVPIALTDPDGDVTGGNVDFGTIWLADDDRFLFIRIETGLQIDPSEDNEVKLIITGGNGRELEWQLGSRQGIYKVNGSITNNNVKYIDIDFRGMPTIDANEFEFAVALNSTPDGIHLLINSSQVEVRFEDETGGDRIPDTGTGVSYTLGQGPLPPETLINLGKDKTSDLRVVTYNVLNDTLFNVSQQPRFQRQLQAVAPDIINFQEVRSNSPAATRSLIESWLPLPDGENWFATGGSVPANDTITVSRFPIEGRWDLNRLNSTTGNIAVLLETESLTGLKTLVINAHLPSGSNDFSRQQEVDEIMAFIRDARNPGGALELKENTPIIITGDMNFVGRPQQLKTYLTGDIVDEVTYGSDFAPDWDDSDLFNTISRHTDQRMGYTWRSDFENNFWPGHLDYIVFTDSVLNLRNNYILYTPAMSQSRLTEYELQSNDSLASDHFLFVADFRPAFVDADGNGLPDYWEVLEFGAVGITTDEDDSDSDGATNIAEFMAGTNPQNKDSRFQITQFNLSEDQIMLNWSSVVEKRYVIQESLELNNWTDISEQIDGDGAELKRSVPIDNQEERLFYRIRVHD